MKQMDGIMMEMRIIFVNYDGPFFNRGGRFGNGGRAGIFFFYRGNGDNQGTSTSFRIALVIK